jgi:hypothetical protein
MAITKAYEEVVEFIAAGTSPRGVAQYPDLVGREKTTGLTAEETSELQSYLQLEHLMRLAKARPRQHLAAASTS